MTECIQFTIPYTLCLKIKDISFLAELLSYSGLSVCNAGDKSSLCSF